MQHEGQEAIRERREEAGEERKDEVQYSVVLVSTFLYGIVIVSNTQSSNDLIF